MTKILKTTLIFTLVLMTFFQNLHSQDFTKNSIKLGFGIGASMGYNTDGLGFIYSVGYQREIWRDRLRFSPNFSIGHYSSKFINDARDQYFNSINLETNLFFDLIKIRAFSIVIGTGALINNSRGLIGTGGRPDYGSTEQIYSEYLSDFHFGGYIGGGFRINSPDSRTAINIMPINIHFGNKYFMEQHVKIEFDIKF
ncbi:MAG: hypothetical protein HOO91_18320 [Bacteroidales bacterium]|nr:hypothetical protein [Bacteroidales bacterium]